MERLVVGRVVKPHGIRGEVVLDVLTDVPERFEPGARVAVGARALTVESARRHQGRLLVKFAEVPDRNGAEELRGAALTVDESEAAPLAEGSYYPWQLEGFDVVDTTGATLGTFARAEEGVANDLWVVRTGAREVLVPAVKEIVVDVDLDARRIMLDPPEGLF